MKLGFSERLHRLVVHEARAMDSATALLYVARPADDAVKYVFANNNVFASSAAALDFVRANKRK